LRENKPQGTIKKAGFCYEAGLKHMVIGKKINQDQAQLKTCAHFQIQVTEAEILCSVVVLGSAMYF